MYLLLFNFLFAFHLMFYSQTYLFLYSILYISASFLKWEPESVLFIDAWWKKLSPQL